MSVPGERPETAQGMTPGPEGSGLPLVASNAEILAWLDVLLKGKPEQQALARTEIAMILEARGHTADAEEAYWTNVQARATDRRAYERLIAIYQASGDRLSESLVRRQLDEVFNAGIDSRAAGGGQSSAPGASPGSRAAGHHGTGQHPGQHPGGSGARATVHRGSRPGASPSPPPVQRVRRLRSARQTGPDATALPEANGAVQPPAQPPEQPPPVATPSPVTVTGPGSATGHAYAAIVQASAARPGSAPAAPPATAAQPVPAAQPALPAPGQARGRPAALSPNPEPAASRGRFPSGGLIALEPTTIGAFLLASFGAAALIAFLLIAAERGFGGRATASPAAPVSAASQLPPRCTDAALRFPGLNDPRAAVVAGYRENGVDVEAPRPGGARLTADQAEQVMGGWIAISLLMERSGQQPPTLAGWLDSETDRPTLANAILAGRRVEGMITPDEWATMRGWTATTCEGAFLHDPRNAGAVRLMERVVSR